MSEDCERKIFQFKYNLITESYKNKITKKGKENVISSSLTSSLSLYKER